MSVAFRFDLSFIVVPCPFEVNDVFILCIENIIQTSIKVLVDQMRTFVNDTIAPTLFNITTKHQPMKVLPVVVNKAKT